MATSISNSAASARESARRGNGEFGVQERGEVDMDLDAGQDEHDTDTPDYSSWTPVEVDTELARLYGEHQVAMSRYGSTYDFVNGEIARNKFNRGFRGSCSATEMRETIDQMQAAAQQAKDAGEHVTYNDKQILDQWEKACAHRAEASRIEDEMEPFNEEFQSRGGWTRAFLVTNAGGHVHKHMDCSTCFKPGYDNSGNYRQGTQFHWVTELSGSTESEVVDSAGERACTTCYPDAPVSTLNKPTSLFTPDEVEKAKAREKRAEEKLARDAAKIAKGLTEDGSELQVDVGSRYPERFKTEQAATTWMVGEISTSRAVGWGSHYGIDEAKQRGIDQIKDAIVAKRVRAVEAEGGAADVDAIRSEMEAEIEKKVKAKAKREGFAITD